MKTGLFRLRVDQAPEQLRAGRGGTGVVHITSAEQPTRGAAKSLCGAKPPARDRKRQPQAQAWDWTDDDVDCGACLRLVGMFLEDGRIVFGDLEPQAAFAEPPAEPVKSARQRAAEYLERRGEKPVDTGGSWTGNGASSVAQEDWYAAGCPSEAAMALAELKEGEHYPQCPIERKLGDRCTCYGLPGDDEYENEIDDREDGR